MTPLADKSIIETLTGSLWLAVPEIVLVLAACYLIVQGMVVKARLVNWMAAAGALVLAALLAIAFHQFEQTVAGFNPPNVDAKLHPSLHAGTTELLKLYDAELIALYAAPVTKEKVESYRRKTLAGSELRTVAPLLPGPFASYIRYLTLATGLILLLLATREAASGIAGEYYAGVLVALAGTSLVARANDIVTLYLALEMISIPTYVLLYLPAKTAAGQEAAMKYFLLSILASGLMLFGLSHLYGLAGTTNLTALVETLRRAHDGGASPLAVLAMVLVLAGFAFRITAVPFHYYAPDVYQGGPTAVIAQLAVLPKIAGFAALTRLLGLTTIPMDDLPFPDSTQIPLMLWVLAAVSMTVGNVMALIQDNVKRIFAYSGVAHAGYMLLGLLAATADPAGPSPFVAGLDALLVYLVAYVLMTLGVFAAVIYLGGSGNPVETVDDLAGAGRTSPVAAACLAVSLLSLIGLPLTAGFSGKLLLFFSLFELPPAAGLGVMNRVLVAIAALNAAIGAVYYLRLLAVIYLRTPLNPDAKPKGAGPLLATLLCAAGTLTFGIAMNWLPALARAASPVVLPK